MKKTYITPKTKYTIINTCELFMALSGGGVIEGGDTVIGNGGTVEDYEDEYGEEITPDARRDIWAEMW